MSARPKGEIKKTENQSHSLTLNGEASSHPFTEMGKSVSKLKEDKAESSHRSQANLLAGYRFVNNPTEENHTFTRDNDLPGVRGQSEEEELLERQQTMGDTPQDPGESKLLFHFEGEVDGMDQELQNDTAKDYIKLAQTNFILLKRELWVDMQ